MSRSSHRAVLAGMLALPMIVGVGLLGRQFPGDTPAPEYPAGPPGTAPIGSASYKVPDDALFVAPSGDDAARGSKKHPLCALGKAIDKAGSKGTIVLRGGVYHQTATVPAGRRLTIQAYPHEAVWFDGSSPVTGWKAEDGAWVRSGWTAKFDSSPSYTAGAQPSDDVDFQFVSPEHPMAAHPDQLWVGEVPQKQVGSRDEVKGGTFYVDEDARRLYMGSDPRGHDVRASTLGEAITLDGAGSTLRGIGVRRYATSLPELGTVKVTAPDVTVENVAVDDSATTGLSVLAAHARVRRVTASRNGLLGIHANYADDLRVEKVRSDHNNLEHFKYSPVSGGIKVTRSRKVAVTGSVVTDNLGKGVWMDESVYDVTLTGDRILRNADHGVALELSAKAVVAGNVIAGNAGTGLKVNDTSDVQIWNNSMAGNGRTIHLVQDGRRRDDPGTPGRDPRQKGPDPAMTWRIGKITVSGNVLADARQGAPCLLCVEDHTRERSAGPLNPTVNGNLYVRPDARSPRTLILWTGRSFADLDRFRSATGQEARGLARTGGSAAGAEGVLAAGLRKRADAEVAVPLPAAIAELVGKPAGTRHIGAWAP